MDPQSFIATWLGVKYYYLVAGFAGGLLRAAHKREAVLKALVSAGAGAIAAAYLTPLALHYSGLPRDPSIEHAAAFLIGYSGLVVCDFLMKKLSTQWSAEPPATKP